jgi:hypothetical protein
MGLSALDLISLTPHEQAAALLAFMAHPDSARDRAAWLELHDDLPNAQTLFDAVQSLPRAERLPVWERLATAQAGAPLETRQELVSDARELLRVGGRVSMLRKLLWVCQRHVLAGQTTTATQPVGAKPTLPERLDITQSLAACCFAAWISECIPQPELTLDLSDATSANQRWWEAVTARWREHHGDKALGLPKRDKVDADLALRSLRLLQSLPAEHASGLLSQWVEVAMQMAPPDTPLHPSAADALRLTANLLKVGMPGALGLLYTDVPLPAVVPVAPVVPAVPVEPTTPAEPVVAVALTAELSADAARRYATAPSAPAPLRAADPPPPPTLAPPPPTAPPPPPPAPRPVPPPAMAPPKAPPLSPMDRPFGVPSRPAEVAFVFKASLLHLPGDPDFPPSDTPDDPADDSVPPSPSLPPGRPA